MNAHEFPWGPVVVILWLVMAGPVCRATFEWCPDWSNQKVAALAVFWPAALAIFIAWALLTKTVPAVRFIGQGIGEWIPNRAPRKPAHADPVLEAAQREVEQIAPEEP